MKNRNLMKHLSPSGFLRWSTFCILAGGSASLTSCDRGVRYVATEQDMEMAEVQTRVEKVDQQEATLKRGEVSNNFHLAKVGYYHAAAHQFFEHPYGFQQDGRWFVNGVWQDQAPPAGELEVTRPTPEALAQVDAALAQEQKAEGNSGGGQGFGMGNALMMYWLLAGNRGMFGAGAGFQQASGRAQNWQRGIESQRSAVGRHAAANPGYQKMVQQSRASGTPIRPGQAVRGGFGSRSSGFSSGS